MSTESNLLRSQHYWRLWPKKVSGHPTRGPVIVFHLTYNATFKLKLSTHIYFLLGVFKNHVYVHWVTARRLLNMQFCPPCFPPHPLLPLRLLYTPVINMLTQHLGALYFFFLAVCKTLLNHASCLWFISLCIHFVWPQTFEAKECISKSLFAGEAIQ